MKRGRDEYIKRGGWIGRWRGGGVREGRVDIQRWMGR